MSTSVLGAGDQASAVAAEASCASWRWDLHRACALSPRQCAAGLAIPLALSGAVGTVYAGTGFPLVALFVAAEWLAVALAFVVYARHARDGEWVTLADGELVIELRHAERTQ